MQETADTAMNLPARMATMSESWLINAVLRLGLADEIIPVIGVTEVFMRRLANASLMIKNSQDPDTNHAKTTAAVDNAVETMERLLPEYRRILTVLDEPEPANRKDCEEKAGAAEEWQKTIVSRHGGEGGIPARGKGEARKDAETSTVLLDDELELIHRRLAERG